MCVVAVAVQQIAVYFLFVSSIQFPFKFKKNVRKYVDIVNLQVDSWLTTTNGSMTVCWKAAKREASNMIYYIHIHQSKS